MAPKMLQCLFVLLGCLYLSEAQISSGTILDRLTRENGLKTFRSWCQEAMPGLYSGTGVLTVFAFNDTAFNTMPTNTRARLNSLTMEEKRDYLQTYTLEQKITVNQLHDNSTAKALNGRQLFINKRSRLYWMNPASATGTTSTFINGAMITSEQLQCSNGIIHVLDRPLNPVSNLNVYQWLMNPDDPTIQTSVMKRFIENLQRYYYSAVTPLETAEKVTFFLPSENALRKISSKLNKLQEKELADYFKQHYILNCVVYTSYVEHQENYESAYQGSRILLMRQDADRVLVKSGGVTAMIERGNITVANGVIHIIDRMFGYVYNSAREQIAQDAPNLAIKALNDRLSKASDPPATWPSFDEEEETPSQSPSKDQSHSQQQQPKQQNEG